MTMTMIQSCVDVENKPPKKTRGKLKIEIKKIEKYTSRHVTFTKRRNGLFKKANELAVATGAQVGIIVESIGGNKIHTFGHPNLDTVIDRYLEAEKDKEKKDKFWWNRDVNGLGFEELQIHLAALLQLKKNVMARADSLKSIPSLDSTCVAAAGVSTPTFDDSGLDHPQGFVDNHCLVADNSRQTSFDTTYGAAVGVDHPDGYVDNEYFSVDMLLDDKSDNPESYVDNHCLVAENSIQTSLDGTCDAAVSVSTTSDDDCGFDHPEGCVVNDSFAAENSIHKSFDTTCVAAVDVSTSSDDCVLVHPEGCVDNEYLSVDKPTWNMFDGPTVSDEEFREWDDKWGMLDGPTVDSSDNVEAAYCEYYSKCRMIDQLEAVVKDAEEDTVLNLWDWDDDCQDFGEVIN